MRIRVVRRRERGRHRTRRLAVAAGVGGEGNRARVDARERGRGAREACDAERGAGYARGLHAVTKRHARATGYGYAALALKLGDLGPEGARATTRGRACCGGARAGCGRRRGGCAKVGVALLALTLLQRRDPFLQAPAFQGQDAHGGRAEMAVEAESGRRRRDLIAELDNLCHNSNSIPLPPESLKKHGRSS
ncbi:hypothetical protein B0H13DRAFT_2024093 [Mycena leptocephala]|nr:hypothetical protein B0H13DRAFT_2024093 [Mycena leptocephala]